MKCPPVPGPRQAIRRSALFSGAYIARLAGAIRLVGYGRDQQHMLDNQAFNIVHTVQ